MKPVFPIKPVSRIADLRLTYAAYLRLGLGLAAAGSALADTTWTGAVSQDWNNAANWDNGLPLDASNNGAAFINLATGNFPIHAAGASQADFDILVGNGGGNSGRVDHSSGTLATGNGNWLFVGANGGTGTYNLTGDANLNAGAVNVGAWGGGGATGTMVVNTSGTLNANAGDARPFGFGDASILVGENGSNGTFDLQNGTVNASFGATFGQGASTGTLNLAGGTLNVTGEIQIGRSGTGIATQSGGTLSSTGYFVVAREQGSVSSYTMTGGTVNAATGFGVTVIGSSRGTTGTLAVGGSGVFTSNAGMTLGEGWQQVGAASGTLDLSGSGLVTVGGPGVQLGLDAAAVGTVNLDGGTLQATRIYKGAGTGTLNLNGGVLKAGATNTNDFLTGLTAANVEAGGALIDSNGFDIAIGQSLLDGGGNGGLTKSGSGLLNLSGSSTYTGATSVNAGTLDLDGTLASDIAVANGAILTGIGSTTGSATFNAGSTLIVDLSGFPLTANQVNFAGATSVVFTGGTLDQGLTYDVIVDNGGGITGAGNLIATSRGTFGSAPGKITFTAGGAGTRTWSTTSGTWDINGAANWLEGDKKFLNGDTVVFNNPAAASSVTLTGTLFPVAVDVNNTTQPYTFTGSGSISGSAVLTKDGSGTLTLANANSHTGGTVLNGGTLNLNHASSLGAGDLTLNGGSLGNTSGSALALTANLAQYWNGDFGFAGPQALDLGTGAVSVGGFGPETSRTVTIAAGTLAVGEISAPFHGLVKQGAGTLEVTSTGIGAGASVVSGPVQVAAGTLQINRTGTNAAASGDFTAAGLTGTGSLVNGAAVERWFFSNPFDGSHTFSGTLANGNAGGLGFNKSGAGTQILSGANSYTGWTTVNGGELVISGNNSGAGTYTELVTGKLTLANTQSLGAATLIRFFGDNVSTLDLATDTDGTAYAITKATGVNIAIVSNRATPGAGINHTLTTENLANGLGGGTLNITSGANVTSGTGRITFTQLGLGAGSVQTTTLNPTTANVTLGNVSKQNNDVSQTLGLGGTSTDNLVTGVISNGPPLTGANSISVLKTGTSTWTLSGANTYTGGTTVESGTLVITQPVLADGAAVGIATAGVLTLTHAATDTVDRFFIDGVEQASGTWGSLTSSATNKTARITGSGILLATNGTAPAGFGSWATALGLTAANDDATDNPDNDGADNATEYILGGHPLSGSNNPKIHSFVADSSDVGTEKELILTIAVPQGTPAFSAGSPASTATFEGFGITVRGSTDLATFPVTVTPVDPVVTGLPAAPVQGGISYEYRSFSLGGSNSTPGKGFLQVTVTAP